MQPLTFDLCLLILEPTDNTGNDRISIISMQTDHTLRISTSKFIEQEKAALKSAGFLTKELELLTTDKPMAFNSSLLTLRTNRSIMVQQKSQASKLQTVNLAEPSFKQAYIEQRAWAAYIAAICQPEALFDLSTAAQCQEPTAAEAKALNLQLQWQVDNQA